MKSFLWDHKKEEEEEDDESQEDMERMREKMMKNVCASKTQCGYIIMTRKEKTDTMIKKVSIYS